MRWLRRRGATRWSSGGRAATTPRVSRNGPSKAVRSFAALGCINERGAEEFSKHVYLEPTPEPSTRGTRLLPDTVSVRSRNQSGA